MEDILNTPPNKTPNKRNSRSLLPMLLVMFLILGFLLYLPFAGSSNNNRISFDEFDQRLQAGEVTHVVFQGGLARVRFYDSEIDEENFPRQFDSAFEYIIASQIDAVNQFNANVITVRALVEAGEAVPAELQRFEGLDLVFVDTLNVRTNWFLVLLPTLIPVLLLVVGGFLIWRLISGKAAGGSGFAKSKAKIAEKSNITFNDIAGADEEKEETQEIVEFLKNPAKFKQLGARIPKGVLLVGPPGTGKTLLAKAVAGESNVPFFSISGSDFVELYVGVGAGRVRDLFETAKKNAPCIIFIDEIDAVGRQRGAGLGGGNDEREQTLNQLLVEMDGFEGNSGIIILAATNRVDILDPALLRAGRFDRQVYVNPPDVKGREGIIKIHAKNKPLDSEINITSIARLTSGFTGADIESFLNEAAILAARDNRLTITMEDITEGINKVIIGPQKKSKLVTELDKKITAYHEAGHAIIAKLLKSGEEVHEVSIIPRGQAGGYTSTRPEDDNEHLTLSRLNNRICMLMGGRVAEDLIFKDISAGASSDISVATNIARKMVTEWGMSDKLGFINVGKGNEIFVGRDYQTQSLHSESTAALIDSEMKRILDENYKKAVKILTENKQIMDNMAELLLDKETIYGDEVTLIMQGKSPKEVALLVDKRENDRKVKEAKKREEAEQERAKQLQELKLRTAEALFAAKQITAEEYEVIKKDAAKIAELQAKAQELKAAVETKVKAIDKKLAGKDSDGGNNVVVGEDGLAKVVVDKTTTAKKKPASAKKPGATKTAGGKTASKSKADGLSKAAPTKPKAGVEHRASDSLVEPNEAQVSNRLDTEKEASNKESDENNSEDKK